MFEGAVDKAAEFHNINTNILYDYFDKELEEQLTKDRKRLDILRNEIYNDINNANSIIKDTLKISLELEMVSIRKEKENELESQLTEDRNRLDKIRAEIAEEIAIETAKLNIYKKAKQLI